MRIDFHAHILPATDHGCDSAEMARRQLDLASSVGIEAIVATPHFYPHQDTVEHFVERQFRGAAKLHSVLKETDPQVFLGAEVLVCTGMERMTGLKYLCIERTDQVILLELPFHGVPEEIWETICDIRDQGYQPVLAHLDRYDRTVVQRALSLHVPFQLNADAFHSVFNRKKWKSFVGQGVVYALGSDIHGISPEAYSQFKRAISILGDDADVLMKRTAKLLKLSN